LAFIEEDHCAELARRVAMGMVTYLQRPGNQAQMSMFTTALRLDHALVRQALDHVRSTRAIRRTRPAWRPTPA
jgi:transcriptional regulator GlxA family with amidase domain